VQTFRTNFPTVPNETLGDSSVVHKKGKSSDIKFRQVLLRERKSAVTLIVISSAFILCGLPWNLMSLADAVSSAVNPAPQTYFLAFIAVLSNSFMNPIVYAARMPEFRKAVKTMFSFK
jgi:hypothetical protein